MSWHMSWQYTQFATKIYCIFADDPVSAYLEKTEEGLLYCAACGYESANSACVKRHVEAKHLTHAYPCKFCPKVCNSKHNILRHMRNKHKDKFQYTRGPKKIKSEADNEDNSS